MELTSQKTRKLAPENDPLKMGMGWKVDDLSKPQILVESTFGDSHPGSAHLDQFVKETVQAVNENGGKAARYFATDMCDGIAQGHDGINYSLPHRDAIVNLVEAQANASVYDGGVFIASCDKSVPAMLMSIGRLKDMSAIVVTGGVMEAYTLPKEYVVDDPACAINELLTLEQIGKIAHGENADISIDFYHRWREDVALNQVDDGCINYSLPHRDAIVNLVEAQANASVYDGGVFIASCDKSVPAMLMSIGRLKDMSAIVVTGGVMEAYTLPKEYVVDDPACAINELLTLEQIGKFDAWEKTGVIPNSQLDYYKHNACPSCGACSFMGTASTMQIMAEALGLMLPSHISVAK